MLKKVKRGRALRQARARRKSPFMLRHSTEEERTWLRRRRRSESLFRRCGFAAILVSVIFLGGMMFSILSSGYTAFIQVNIRLPVEFRADQLADVRTADYRKILLDSAYAFFPNAQSREEKRAVAGLFSKGAYYKLRDMVLREPSLVGQRRELWLPASGDIDLFVKRHDLSSLSRDSRVSAFQFERLKDLQEAGRLKERYNRGFFRNADSQEPEQAGILGSMIGSFFSILVCIGFAFPIGVATALYLEEFAKENWLTDLIEININNLAAVPSIIYGLLGLSIYINAFGLPRSSPLVGGLVLAVLVLPVIVIATRNALRAVPRAIRFAALAMGATPVQTAVHHTFLYALPGIMTGVILSVARALGETSPLLMIGMVAFVTDIPKGITDPAAALPVQIYLWSNNPEAGFVEKTAAAIIVLLVFLGFMNALAAWVRQRFEIKW